MRVLWINPRFLDYRIPVYRELNDLLDGQLTVVFSQKRTPQRVVGKIEAVLGPNAIGLSGERTLELGHKRQAWANACLRIPYQPGLLRTLMRIKTDVIIAEGFFQWTPAALIKSLWQNIPLAIAYERTHHTERHCPRWRAIYRKGIIHFIDAVLCSGTQCSEYTQSLGMPAARISCGHMSADTELLRRQVEAVTPEERARIRARLRVEGLAFLFAGRLIELKGVGQLLEGWRRFERACPGGGTLLIAGEGPLRPALERLAHENKLHNVRFLDHVDYDSIARQYATADVFVLPTLEDNWALVIPEAMASGLPVLCSRYNGACTDLIRNGENGWVFDPLDAQDTFEHLRGCLEQRERLSGMGCRGQELIQEHTPARAAASVIEGCRLAIEHRKRRKKGGHAVLAKSGTNV